MSSRRSNRSSGSFAPPAEAFDDDDGYRNRRTSGRVAPSAEAAPAAARMGMEPDEDDDEVDQDFDDDDADDGGDDSDADEDDEDDPPRAVNHAAEVHQAGEKRLRRSSAPPVSYKEPRILEGITRAEAPSPPPRPKPMRVGDVLEVEVKDDDEGLVWKPAEVRQILRRGRFKVRINNEDDFVEEYGPEDEGSEWRRTSKYDGLKRQRKSVDLYKPESLKAGRHPTNGDDFSTRVGPFRHGRDGGDGGGGGGGGHRHHRRSSSRRRRGGDESSTMSSEEEFADRKRRSDERLATSVQPLVGGGDAGGGARLSSAAAAKLAGAVGGGVRRGGGAASGRRLDDDRSGRNGSAPSTSHDVAAPVAAPDARDTSAAAGGSSHSHGKQVVGPGGSATAGDLQPMAVDGSVGWDQVGGLQTHVEALKEMVVLPLLYPHVFTGLGVTPPRGVLFHGPPGTGAYT